MKIPTHLTYDALISKWNDAWNVYSGEFIDPGKIADYLIQRKQGEATAAYDERKKLVDPALDFAIVADSLNGMQFANEDRTSRTWQPEEVGSGLGDPEEEGTVAYRLARSVDGEGTKLQTLLWKVGVRFSVLHRVWGLVDTAITSEAGDVLRPPAGYQVDARDVVNWRKENGRLVQVLVRDRSDGRSDIMDEFDEADYYVLYELEGWKRLKDKEGELTDTGESGEYAFFRTSEKKQRILPIFMVELPLPRMVGYLLAQKNVALLNSESELDTLLRLCCMPRFGVDTGEMGTIDFEDVRDDIADGQALIEGTEHKFIVPPSEAAAVRNERLKQKRIDFYAQAFREYGNAAKEQTATEKKQDWAAGVAAYLTLQSGSLEAFEEELMWRFEQAEFPDKPAVWGQYGVSRSTEFEPQDIREMLDRLKKAVFGAGPMPVGIEVATEVATRYLDEHGIDADPDKVREAISQQKDQDAQMASGFGGGV